MSLGIGQAREHHRSLPTRRSAGVLHWLRGGLAGKFWRVGLTVLVGIAAVGGSAWWWATTPPAGVTREVASWVRDLQRQPALYQRLATATAARIHRTGPRYLPGFLHTERVELKRLEACHRLVALGPGTLPLVPEVTQAFADPDPTTSFYAFLVLVHSTAPASAVVAAAREAWGSTEGPAQFYAGLLVTEDESIREFAWQCLETAGDDAWAAVAQIRGLAKEGEPEIRQRAERLLQRLDATSSHPAGVGQSPRG